MPLFVVPDSAGLRENNDCNLPAGEDGGQFGRKDDPRCGASGQAVRDEAPTYSGEPLGKWELESALYEWEQDEFKDYPEGKGAKDIADVLSRFGVKDAKALKGADGSEIHVFDLDSERTVYDGSSVKSAEEWLNDMSSDEVETFAGDAAYNEAFWKWPQTLYHATSEENGATIDTEGLGPRNKTRGLTNRSVGDAVFTSLEIDEGGTYGDLLYEIDTAAMKADGYVPEVGREPDAAEGEYRQAIAHRLGLEDYYFETLDQGAADPNTVIVYGHIPPKYLHRVGN